MKTIKTILFLCAALCFASSCKKEVDMTLMQKTVFQNADIRQIEVSDAWDVTVVADSNTYVELEYSAYLETYLKATMEDSKLEIGFTGNVYPAINSVYRATLHTNKIERIKAEDASSINFTGVFEGTQLTVEMSDASICSGPVFSGQYCEIDIDDASKLLDFHFDGPACKVTLRKASQFNGQIHAREALHITLEDNSRFVNKGGLTAQADIIAKHACLMNMAETQVHEMHVELSEASEATVWVNALLKGMLTEASTLFYKGGAEIDVNCSDDSQLIPF